MTEKFSNIPEQKSMSESETLSFLKEQGIEPLTDWQPGQPLLYVFEENERENMFGYVPKVGEALTREGWPIIARLQAPTSIDFNERMLSEEDPNRIVYPLLNENDERIDFYVIDPETKEISFMLLPKSQERGKKDKPFHVRKETLFKANDSIFPPSTHVWVKRS